MFVLTIQTTTSERKSVVDEYMFGGIAKSEISFSQVGWLIRLADDMILWEEVIMAHLE
jgi:hypothetical protein